MSELDLPALQAASRVLHEHFLKDAQAVPDLGDMLTIRMSFHDTIICNSASRSDQPALNPRLHIASFPTTFAYPTKSAT